MGLILAPIPVMRVTVRVIAMSSLTGLTHTKNVMRWVIAVRASAVTVLATTIQIQVNTVVRVVNIALTLTTLTVRTYLLVLTLMMIAV